MRQGRLLLLNDKGGALKYHGISVELESLLKRSLISAGTDTNRFVYCDGGKNPGVGTTERNFGILFELSVQNSTHLGVDQVSKKSLCDSAGW